MSNLLTVPEVARILRVDPTTVRRWIKQGALESVTLPHVSVREVHRVKRETLDKVLGEQGGYQTTAKKSATFVRSGGGNVKRRHTPTSD